MVRPQYFPIGHVRKPFGTQGAVSIQMFDELEEILDEIEHVFIFVDGQYLPYFIEEIDEKSDVILQFDIIDNPEKASALSGKKMYITHDQVNEEWLTVVSKWADLIGYEVYQQDQYLGKVEAIVELPSQLMIQLTLNGKEKLLPFIDQFLHNIDHKLKKIVLQLPEGILEL